MKSVALLSNVTVDLLGEMLKKEIAFYVPKGFDVWQQEIYSPLSDLYQKNFDAVIVLLYAQAYKDMWKNKDSGSQLLREWLSAISALLEKAKTAPVFVSSLDIQDEKCRYGAEEQYSTYFENLFLAAIDDMHRKGQNIYVLPVKDLVEDYGRKNVYSNKMWYMGGMPYSMKGLKLLAELIRRYVFTADGAKKKCLALDLDNTLWGGVIGEDGVEGICLSDNKEGARYKDAQKLLKKMCQQGVMLAILSKNNADDVEAVFAHPDMVLQHDDFVAEEINWKTKPENIQRMAKLLNIGLDAFVFLDDNPAEREMMRVQCPEVTVADFPKDTSLLPDIINEINNKYFFTLEITEEDRNKTKMYQGEARRKEAFRETDSLEDYLRRLEMNIDIHLMREDEETRVVQLIHKTNQFNLTTKRYGAEAIQGFWLSQDSDIITVSMSDKYGKQGLVGVLILKYEKGSAFIDTFLMSCRVMGRNAEQAILGGMKLFLKQRGVEYLRAAYIKTAKNQPVESLYEQMGFQLIASTGDKDQIGYIKEYGTGTDCLPELPDCFAHINLMEVRK